MVFSAGVTFGGQCIKRESVQVLLSIKWFVQVSPSCCPPGKKRLSLCNLSVLDDFTADLFKSALEIRHREASWLAESKGITFYALNNGNLLLEPESLEEYRIRMDLIFSGVACWGMTSFQTPSFQLKRREKRLCGLREKGRSIRTLNLE